MKKLITPSFADTPIAEDLGAGRNKHGVICAATESRFVAGHYSEQLTGLTVGWKDPENLEAILDALFPIVPVSRRFDFKKAENAQAFLSEVDDLRAIGAPFKRVEYSGTEASSKTLNKGLTVSIDHDQTDDLEAEVALTVGRIQQRLVRNDLRRGMTLLDSQDANDTATWNAASNPDKTVRARLRASADTTGVFPNVVAFGELAWHYRLDAYEVASRNNGGLHADWTPERLAAYFMVDRVVPVKARYQSSATAKSAILSARIYAYLAMQGMSKDDPSAVKRFQSQARGGRFGVYREEHAKCTEVSVEHYSNIVYTGLGIVSLDVTQGSDV